MRPKYISRRVWYGDMIGRYTDRIGHWLLCHVAHRHVPKLSTWPNCLWCGKRAVR